MHAGKNFHEVRLSEGKFLRGDFTRGKFSEGIFQREGISLKSDVFCQAAASLKRNPCSVVTVAFTHIKLFVGSTIMGQETLWVVAPTGIHLHVQHSKVKVFTALCCRF